jgi:6-phosphogluconate dehydrogenase
MKKADIGLIGLAVMGENLVMNMESKGFTVAVYNRTMSKGGRLRGGPGDIIIDGGNSTFDDTNRRRNTSSQGAAVHRHRRFRRRRRRAQRPEHHAGRLARRVAVCEGHLPGHLRQGRRRHVPCCDWVGEMGAGHYVKMVHNGIEYGDMQLICEAYNIMKTASA